MADVPVNTQEYIKYRDEHDGCCNIEAIYYRLHDKMTDNLLIESMLAITDEHRKMVHDGLCSSAILACLDKHSREMIDRTMPLKESGDGYTEFDVEQDRNPELPEEADPAVTAYRRKTNTIVWQVLAINDDAKTVKVKGVI